MVALAQSGAIERMLLSDGDKLTPDVARAILHWRFAESDQCRVDELSAKARAGRLSDSEAEELDWYLLLGDFLTIVQAKARIALQQRPSSAA